jgi:hypothetical protein
MSTKLTLLTGTLAFVSIADFKNILGQTVPAPAGAPAFTPADPAIVTVAETVPGQFAFTAGAIGNTSVAFVQGAATDTIAVEVLDAGTPSIVDFTIGPVTAVRAPPEAVPLAAEAPVADSTAQAEAQPTGL